ncbi:MAG: hypothetical protein AB9846_03775 [Tenuifilaceae bacterium]
MEKDLAKIFTSIKRLLKKYENPLVAKLDLDSKYDLWSIKDVEFLGKKRKEVYFAGLIIQSNYVGFYYMPVYANEDLKKVFHPDLLKLLKGKSCFHIKTLDKDFEKNIEEALKIGYDLYKKNGWA